jgi:hypothetical protein
MVDCVTIYFTKWNRASCLVRSVRLTTSLRQLAALVPLVFQVPPRGAERWISWTASVLI